MTAKPEEMMDPEQLERIIVALERIARAVENVAKAYERIGFDQAPQPKRRIDVVTGEKLSEEWYGRGFDGVLSWLKEAVE
jgi:hypothetical protein